MGAGDAVGGFFSGFSQGLAGGVNTARERRDRLRREEQERKARLGAALLPHAIENAESEDDLREVLKMLDPEFDTPQPGTKGGKKKPSAFEAIRPHLAPWLGGNAKVFGMGGGKKTGSAESVESAPPAAAPAATASPVAAAATTAAAPGPTGQTDIAAGYGIPGTPPEQAAQVGPVGQAAQTATGIDTSIASPTSTYGRKPAAPPAGIDTSIASPTSTYGQQPAPTGATLAPTGGKSFYGIETGTKEERAVRQIERARVVLKEMKKVDPNASLEDALYMLKTGTMARDYTSGGGVNQSVAGEVIDPATGRVSSEFGIFTRDGYVYPQGHEKAGQPIPGFRPRTTTGSSSMGTEREALARERYGRTFAQLSQEEQTAVNQELPTRIGQTAEARAAGTGRARIATELKMPIGTTAAAAYNVPPTTTLEELRDRIALSPEQYDKLASLGQVDLLLGEIDTLIPQVFPNVQPGVWGRIQTQFSLAKQKLMADTDYAALDASMSAALAQIAQLSGQPGSRLSDRDVELARATMANLTPQWFGGDTRQSAMARMRELRKLFDKAQGAVIRPVVSAGGSVTPAPAPGGGVGAGAPPPAVVPSRQPATGPAGVTMDENGNIIDASGKVIR